MHLDEDKRGDIRHIAYFDAELLSVIVVVPSTINEDP